MDDERPLYYDDIPEIVPYEDYDHHKAKQRASILWLIAKSSDNGRVPDELRDPFYRDHNGIELLKPWITQRLANGELYGRALANIYGVPDYSCLGHQGILQLLTRRGVYVQEMGTYEEPITETLLLKTSPVKLNAHMIIIECILTLYVREILIPVKVGEVVSRFTGDFDSYDGSNHEQELPPSAEPEDVALYWVNKACIQLNQEIARDYMTAINDGHTPIDDEPCPVVPSLDELSDMCDGCSLFGLLVFYCSSHLEWREICLKQDISIADSIYNLQRVQCFTAEHFPSDVCFLTLEDFLYLPEPLVPNFLAFIADLLFLFEIQPIEIVTSPYLRLYPEGGYGDEFHPNYPQLPTPSEMKARSLKHQSWNDSLEIPSAESSAFYNHPSTHQLFNDRRTTLFKTGSNSALNQTSRRNSLSTNNNNNGSRILHRRSSIMSNGSESQPSGTAVLNSNELDDPYGNSGMGNRYHHDGDSENSTGHDGSGSGGGVGGQLSSYFSTLSVSNNQRGGVSSTNPVESSTEYYKNRNRASSGHLTDYFSNLALADQPEPPINFPAMNVRNNTHVRAKATHPNNADNVKSLLNQRHHDLVQHQHSAFTNTMGNDSSQTTSSETSSIAELSEYSDMLRAQLNEKRKQIELERQHEREKRLSVDQNFRQEVLRTLKGINHPSGESNSDTENGLKMSDTMNNNNNNNNTTNFEDENLTFEIRELNPIRRENTFTSLATTNSRKNLFSASEDLKVSMTDLNYSNAKDNSSTSIKSRMSDGTNSPRIVSNNKCNETQSKLDSSFEEKKFRNSISPTDTNYTNVQQVPPPPSSSVEATSYHSQTNENSIVTTTATSDGETNITANSTPRRNQWGQPMMPLAGHYPGHHHPPPPNWSQTPASAYAEWYAGNAYPPHHPSFQPYPYGMAPPPPGTPLPGIRPYSMQPNMDPSQYGTYNAADPYMSMNYVANVPTNTTPNGPGSTGTINASNVSQLYASSPVLNMSGPQPMGAATFRVQKNPGAAASSGSTPNGVIVSPDSSNTQNVGNILNDSSVNQFVESPGHGQSNVNADSSSHQHTGNTEKHNEAFFISFSDERSVNRGANKQTAGNKTKTSQKQQQNELHSPEKQPLTRTATQTLVPRSNNLESAENESNNVKNQPNDDIVKQLYDVKRPPATQSIAFVVGKGEVDSSQTKSEMGINGINDQIVFNDNIDNENRSRVNVENEMTRKKEQIMQQSLRRRIEQEKNRIQKEQELAAKRESERIKREQMDRKKEEERAKRTFILEQYKQRKQMEEEMEKNGGALPVSRSSSTLMLNRQTGQSGSVMMRPQRLLSSGKPRPKSLHSTLIGLDGNPINNNSGTSGTGTGTGVGGGRISTSRDQIDHIGRMSVASRPQSALSSQSHSTVTTPTSHGPFGDHFDEQFAMNNTGPTSNTFYEYNGPKLFVKPSQKSNKTLILNAINVVLAGAVNAETNRRVAEVINSCDSKYYLILFRNSGLQYRAIYSYYPEREEVVKLDGIGPRSVNNEMIDKFYKYNSGTKSFTSIQTKHLCVTIDAFTIHNNLWMTKKQQQQQQMTPRRFI